MTAKRFLDLLLHLRAEQDAICATGDVSTGMSTMGVMLDRAALYGCSSEIIGNDGGVPIYKRHPRPNPDIIYMRVRDDSILCRRAGSNPRIRDGWLLSTCENIWASLSPVQRTILLLARQMSIADIVSLLQKNNMMSMNGKQITYRFVVWITEQASRTLERHSLFRTLDRFDLQEYRREQ